MPVLHEMGTLRRRMREQQSVYRMLLCALVGVVVPIALWGGTPSPMQTTYTVFPAKASTPTTQPTGREGSRITLAVKDSTIEYVVTEIARQAHLRSVYNNHNPLFAKQITIRMTGVSAVDAFAAVLKGT